MKQGIRHSEQRRRRDAASIIVDRLPARTTATWGITGPELNRLNDAVRFLELHCQSRRSDLWLATTARATPRPMIADVWKRITRLQATYGLPSYSVMVLEASGGLHAHITFIGNPKTARRLKASKQFEAGYGREHVLGGRIKGWHQLDGGGDRVIAASHVRSMPLMLVPFEEVSGRQCR